MGAGIVHAFPVAGAAAVIVETDDDTAAGARERVSATLHTAPERGSLAGGVDEVLARLGVSIAVEGMRLLDGHLGRKTGQGFSSW